VLTDLHCHSTASDGDLDPPGLVVAAAGAGVGTLALTDHDTMDGVAAAVAAGELLGVRVVPGIELTVRVPTGSMHLLGYFSAAAPRPLVDRLTGVSAFREQRIRRIVERLADLGIVLDWDDVRGRAAGQLGRPHVAAALVDAGYVATLDEAFERWIADGRPAHVPSQGLEPDAAVRVVRESGGVPVLAHPGSLALPARHLSSFVQRLAAFGLVGIEVHRPEHRPEQRDAYAAIARRLRLVPSGGSDFHRPGGPFGLGDTGRPGLPEDTLERLFDRIDATVPGD
jgi:predicted metal-dependent phosphoesterase TrpH